MLIRMSFYCVLNVYLNISLAIVVSENFPVFIFDLIKESYSSVLSLNR
jgi:hypothetical protein